MYNCKLNVVKTNKIYRITAESNKIIPNSFVKLLISKFLEEKYMIYNINNWYLCNYEKASVNVVKTPKGKIYYHRIENPTTEIRFSDEELKQSYLMDKVALDGISFESYKDSFYSEIFDELYITDCTMSFLDRVYTEKKIKNTFLSNSILKANINSGLGELYIEVVDIIAEKIIEACFAEYNAKF